MVKKKADKQQSVSTRKKKPKGFQKGNKHTFKKGESGNPGGRPKGPDMRKMLTEFMQEEVPDVKTKEKKKRIRMLLEAMFKHAISGNATYMVHLLERMYGKVPQHIESEGGGGIKFTLTPIVND